MIDCDWKRENKMGYVDTELLIGLGNLIPNNKAGKLDREISNRWIGKSIGTFESYKIRKEIYFRDRYFGMRFYNDFELMVKIYIIKISQNKFMTAYISLSTSKF